MYFGITRTSTVGLLLMSNSIMIVEIARERTRIHDMVSIEDSRYNFVLPIVP